MRKLNVLEFVSLDGVIQAPGGRGRYQWRVCVWRMDRSAFGLCFFGGSEETDGDEAIP
jgi:hypothetical protein